MNIIPAYPDIDPGKVMDLHIKFLEKIDTMKPRERVVFMDYLEFLGRSSRLVRVQE